MSEPSTEDRPADTAVAPSADPAPRRLVENLPFPVFLLVEPMVRGKRVLEIGLDPGGLGAQSLRRAGAQELLSWAPEELCPPAPDACADVVLCGLAAELVVDDDRRSAWLAEVQRTLRPGGFCVLHLPAATLQQNGPSARGPLSAAMDMLLPHFATVDIVEQARIAGVSFHVSGTDDLAVNESLLRMAGTAEHILAFCSEEVERPWSLGESLFVPTEVGSGGDAAGELAAWQAEVARLDARCTELALARDGAREERMTLQDRADRLERTVASLRKDVERTLRQLSNDSAARELLTLERNDVQRKLDQARREASEAAQLADKRQASLRALEKEVARLRAARGPDR